MQVTIHLRNGLNWKSFTQPFTRQLASTIQ